MNFLLPFIFITAGFATAFNIVYATLLPSPQPTYNSTNSSAISNTSAANSSSLLDSASSNYTGVDEPRLQIFPQTMLMLFQAFLSSFDYTIFNFPPEVPTT